MKIFISSTAYDLADFRDLTIDRLRKRGHEVVCYEDGTFPVHSGFHSHDECVLAIQECEMVICIVDRRYGVKFSGVLKNNFKNIEYTVRVNIEKSVTKKGRTYPVVVRKEYPIRVPREDLSITWCEMITAIENKIDVITFARDKALNEKQTRRANQGYKQFKPAYVEKNEVFDFLDWITKLDRSNWIIEYSKIVDFEEKLLSWIAEKEKQRAIIKSNNMSNSVVKANMINSLNANSSSQEFSFNKNCFLKVAIILGSSKDREIVKFIVEQMNLPLKIELFYMGGKSMIVNNMDDIVESYSRVYDHVIVLVDSDDWHLENHAENQLKIKLGEGHSSSLIYVVPKIEFWLLSGMNRDKYNQYMNEGTLHLINENELRNNMYGEFDINSASNVSQDFKRFIDLLKRLSSQK